ncbi:glycoside hydrolase family 3 C-terminal domain-containing protein [Nakamurella aerolata]|uniref:PA14 domain-containing protein n=1 Tax=Nakamurella aerolata TaxID=1656892 RepID=A0A849A1T5_9ACTN|nr:glycoside hydrolase family 3 C-terminal domain-containing protein [Nakamurella aerolata]NNG34525.1 hypothetical protein [Nakamurella aerolata]
MFAALACSLTLTAGVLPPVLAQAPSTPAADQGPVARPAAAPAAGDCPWVGSTAPTEEKVKQVVDQLTLDEKIQLVHGQSDRQGYTGLVLGVPRLCIPNLKLQDGPVGVRMKDTTQLPAAVSLAATFDPAIARRYGSVIGAEMKSKGADVDLGPTVNIVRDPRWGRAFESYSEDPYLTAQIGAGTIDGIQDKGVMAQVKHWAVYNQETYRNTMADNAIVDDRTVREMYTKAFEDIIDDSNPSSAMCSYSVINGQFACENAYLDGILKDEWKYDGFVTSDWGGTHSTVPSALNGLDMEMPGSTYFGDALKAAVQRGAVPESELNDKVSRTLRQMFRFGLVDNPSPNSTSAKASTPAHVQFAKQASEQGTVLLRNEPVDGAKVLPFASSGTAAPQSIAVIGAGAGKGTLSGGGGSAAVAGTGTVTPFDGIKDRAGSGISVEYAQGTAQADGGSPAVPTEALKPKSGTGNGLTAQYYNNKTLSGTPVVTRNEPKIDNTWNSSPAPGVPATNFSVRWSGTLTAPTTGEYIMALTIDDGARLKINGSTVIDSWKDGATRTVTGKVTLTAGQPVDVQVEFYQAAGGARAKLGWVVPGKDLQNEAVALAKKSDVAVVYAALPTTEGADVKTIDLPADQNELIDAVAAANPKTVVVLNTGSAVAMPWVDKVAGLIEAWYPGQQSGNAIASVLFGDVDPAGRLPVTFPKSLDDVPAADPARFPGVGGRVEYSEKLQVGYRWYDQQQIEPLYPFGYGLSYTTFGLSDLRVASPLTKDGTATVLARVTNTGKRSGTETVQAYLQVPDPTGQEPPRRLVATAKVTLGAGRSRVVQLRIQGRDATVFNTDAQQWQLLKGDYRLFVGTSSRDLPLQTTMSVQQQDTLRYTSLETPKVVTAGKSFTATTTFVNDSPKAVRQVANTLQVPSGWKASPTTPASVPVLAAGKSLTTTWQVSVPADASKGGHQLTAGTSYAGGKTREVSTTVQVPYLSVADAYNTVGITDDANQAPGDFDGQGYSYSAQALASVGLTPGSAQPGGTRWPTADPGTPNMVNANGQTILLSGSGSTLTILGSANNGVATIPVTLNYSDGSSNTSTVALADWWNAKPEPGSTTLAVAPYINRPANATQPRDHKVAVYAATVPLTTGKQLQSITLGSENRWHLFDAAVS